MPALPGWGVWALGQPGVAILLHGGQQQIKLDGHTALFLKPLILESVFYPFLFILFKCACVCFVCVYGCVPLYTRAYGDQERAADPLELE